MYWQWVPSFYIDGRSVIMVRRGEIYLADLGSHVRIKRRKFEEYLDDAGVI